MKIRQRNNGQVWVEYEQVDSPFWEWVIVAFFVVAIALRIMGR